MAHDTIPPTQETTNVMTLLDALLVIRINFQVSNMRPGGYGKSILIKTALD